MFHEHLRFVVSHDNDFPLWFISWLVVESHKDSITTKVRFHLLINFHIDSVSKNLPYHQKISPVAKHSICLINTCQLTTNSIPINIFIFNWGSSYFLSLSLVAVVDGRKNVCDKLSALLPCFRSSNGNIPMCRMMKRIFFDEHQRDEVKFLQRGRRVGNSIRVNDEGRKTRQTRWWRIFCCWRISFKKKLLSSLLNCRKPFEVLHPSSSFPISLSTKSDCCCAQELNRQNFSISHIA